MFLLLLLDRGGALEIRKRKRTKSKLLERYLSGFSMKRTSSSERIPIPNSFGKGLPRALVNLHFLIEDRTPPDLGAERKFQAMPLKDETRMTARKTLGDRSCDVDSFVPK